MPSNIIETGTGEKTGELIFGHEAQRVRRDHDVTVSKSIVSFEGHERTFDRGDAIANLDRVVADLMGS